MASSKSPFTHRMIHATSPEMIDYGQRIGCNWAVVTNSGHKTVKRPLEDPEVFMSEWDKLKGYREQFKDRIEKRRQQVSRLIARAHKAGMKAIYHAYEPSLPAGFQQAYPRLHVPKGNPYLATPPGEVADQREVCVARREIREALAAKVAELCSHYDIDAYMFSNNECSTLGQVWHRCENCKDIPFGQMMAYLHDAIAEGIRRSGRPVRLMNRCWGTHETEQRYWLAQKQRVEFGSAELPDKAWLAEYVELRRPAKMSFSPKRDIPAYLKKIASSDTMFVYKATWADTNLRHPLNPLMGTYRGHEEVVEFSFEHCGVSEHSFYIMGKEMQRRARLCRRKGVSGICCVPVSWGRQDDNNFTGYPSKWSLNEANFEMFRALAENPDADLIKVTAAWLRKRYGRPLPRELAVMLLDSEDVAAGAMNLNGIRATGFGLETFFSDLLRYAWMFPDWRQRVATTPANLKRIFAAKDRNVAKAKAMCQRIEDLKDRLPGEAYAEFRERFADLRAMAARFAASHKFHMTLWAIKDGRLKPTAAVLHELSNQAMALGVSAASARGSHF